ncbi:restriction endonuclease [Streptomyces davaonensis JCM 4913]|uniref:Restriction endonuclease n=1 Tax=Streptomyces davaonensis (strain DSM 101723 / JCM 4913 / KCC S-0913 / 768) TaxID=1214101 RepID=K4RH06_STRDJ|nr:restriction endonuclease [Streptomyces davaonensis]CCK32779.1 restriction endonuclease [Streptomyces davaonensis JCM 4913]
MAARRRRRLRKRTRRQLQGWGIVATLAVTVWVAGNWATVWPVLVTVVAVVVVGGAGWGLLRAHRLAVGGDRKWRAQEEARARELSMTEVDALSWQDFEHYVADLCRRDGCTKVVVSGKSGDLGADVVGYLADGRKLVVQVKKYAPERSVSSQDMQKFVGTARLEHGADVALFVTTCRAFTKAALGLAVRQDIVALHRDLLGSWVKGAHLETLIPLNGSGGGARRPPA